MSERTDHQALEADKIVLGIRVARALEDENTTRFPRDVSKSRRQRRKAILRRGGQQTSFKPSSGGKAARARQSVVDKLRARDGNRCCYCWAPFTKKLRPTIEHVTPKSAGGTDGLYNLRLACEPCNGAKGGIHNSKYLRGLPSRPRLAS